MRTRSTLKYEMRPKGIRVRFIKMLLSHFNPFPPALKSLLESTFRDTLELQLPHRGLLEASTPSKRGPLIMPFSLGEQENV